MPSAKTQRYLMWLGIIGTFTSCFGCSLAFNNQLNAARAFLILAWLILVPLFGYLIMMRSRASAQYKRRLARREAEAARQASGQAEVDSLLEANGIMPTTGKTDPQTPTQTPTNS